jgi:hypothetical protein
VPVDESVAGQKNGEEEEDDEVEDEVEKAGIDVAAEFAGRILEEEFDPNYEPTEQEQLEYSLFIGIDIANAQELAALRWIARDRLQGEIEMQREHVNNANTAP